MGKERKGKAASAAEAADLLSKSRQGTSAVPSIGKFSFGSRFVEKMSSPVDPSEQDPVDLTAASLASPSVSASIQHLSKSDARTRQKALVSLIDLVESEPSNGIFLMDYWSKQFPKLAQDASKAVRASSCQLTAALSKQVGRKMGSIIKHVFSPLYFAQFDESGDVCRSATAALQEMLPGDKLSAAIDICMEEMLHDFESVLHRNLSRGVKDSPADEEGVRLLCQFLRGARQCFTLKKEKLSKSLLTIVQETTFDRVALQSSDVGVRREAYMLITEMASAWEGQQDALVYKQEFIHSVFRPLKDPESNNYLEVLSMIVAFCRRFPEVWDFLNVRKDFYQPVLAIARLANQSQASVEVNKTFLPLIAALPEAIFDLKEISSIIAGIWKGHNRTGHVPKTCSAVQNTVAECICFVVSHHQDVSMSAIYQVLLNMLIQGGSQAGPARACAQSAIVLVVEKLGGNEGFEAQFADVLTRTVDEKFDEDTMVLLEPLVASLGPSFVAWQVSLLKRMLEFPGAFWLEKDITFVSKIMDNIRIAIRRSRISSGQDVISAGDIQAILKEIHGNLLQRVASNVDPSGIRAIALTISLYDDKSMVLYDTIQKVVDQPGAEAASGLLFQLLRVLASDQESICSMRSTAMDTIALELMHEALHEVDGAKKDLCKQILLGDGKVCLISDFCGCQALDMLMSSARQEASIDSKSVIVDLLSYLFQSGSSLSPVLAEGGFRRECLAFVLQTAWEEMLLDCLGEPLIALEKSIDDILAKNLALKSIKAILKSEHFQKSAEQDWEQVMANTITEEMQFVGSPDAVTLGTMEHTGALYRMLEFCIPIIPKEHVVDVVESLLPSLENFPEAAILVFHDLVEDDDLLTLLRSKASMSRFISILESCELIGCDYEGLIEILMEDAAAYNSMLNHVYGAVMDTGHESTRRIWLCILTKGLRYDLNSSFRTLACDFCQRHLCSGADAMDASVMLDTWGHAVAVIRQDETLVEDSGLWSFVEVLIKSPELTEDTINTLGACHPSATRVDVADRRKLLLPKTHVWYHEASRAEWVPGEILSRDDSIHPPSFMVQVGTAVRETESSRLHPSRAGVFKVPPPNTEKELSISNDIRYNNDEIERVVPVLEKVFASTDPGMNPSYGHRRLLLFGVVHAWDAVGAATRSNLVQYVVATQERISKMFLHLCQSFFENFVVWARDLSGTEFSDTSQAIAFVRKLRANPALQQAPKVKRFNGAVLDELEGLLSTLPHVDISMVIHAYTAIASKERRVLERLSPSWVVQCQRIVTDTLSAYHSLGVLLEATDAIFGLSEHPPARQIWEERAPVLRSLSDGVEIMQMAGDDFCTMLRSAVESNGRKGMTLGGLESLCLNTGICNQVSRVAFVTMLQCSDCLKTVWISDADHLFAIMESLISERHESEPRAMAELLEQSGLQGAIASRMSNPASGDFHTAWAVVLSYLLHPAIESSQKELLVSLMKEMGGLMSMVLGDVVGGLMHEDGAGTLDVDAQSTSHLGSDFLDMILFTNSCRCETDSGPIVPLEALLLALLLALPVACRSWYMNTSSRRQQVFLQNFVRYRLSRLLIEGEFGCLESEAEPDQEENFHITLIRARSQIVASLEVEDAHSVDLRVSFPNEYPLKPANASLTKYVGISEAKARKWNLSITAFLMNRNGSVGEVIQTWKKNVTKEFEGHEDCLICYSVIQPATGQLPKLACKTCSQKFHGTCLYKWFKSSSKSNCPHCQSPW